MRTRGREVTVFGKASAALFYNYSDRLVGLEKYREGCKFAEAQGLDRNTARYYEVVLSFFHNSPCDLQHIVLGCNRSNGFDYLIFGYTYEDKNNAYKS